MSDFPADIDRLLCLADGVCAESASADDLTKLDALLLSDRLSRRYYLDYCQMHSALGLELQAECEVQKLCRQLDFGVIAVAPESASCIAIPLPSVIPTPTTPFPTFLSTTFPSTLGYSSGWSVAYLTATVITGLWLLSMWLTPVSRQVATHSVPQAAEQQLAPESLPASVGRITGMVDCKSADPGTTSISPDVRLGEKLDLASGLMEITYDTGAKVILQGPVTYSVESNGGYLAVGKLTGKLKKGMPSLHPSTFIPHPSANPFVIRTSFATITDVGTEFGVEVDRSGGGECRVFRGHVLVQPAGDGAKEQTGAAVLLGDNESARIGWSSSNGGRQATVVRCTTSAPETFVRELPRARSVAEQADEYAGLVLAMQPVAYYRMERPSDAKDRNVVFDSAPGGHHGVLHCRAADVGGVYDSGRFGKSLCFRGVMVGDHVIVSDYPLTTGDGLTISAWVMTNIRSGCPTIAAIGPFALGIAGDCVPCLRAMCRDGRFAEFRADGSQRLPFVSWQHIAFALGGGQLRLYRNGTMVASGPCNSDFLQPKTAGLTIGSGESEASASSFWSGRIDELAIFDRALPSGEIRTLYDGVKRFVPSAANVGSGAVLGTARSAPMTWQPPVTISDDSDVSLEGTLDRAYCFGSESVTVNGVRFAAISIPYHATRLTVGNTTLASGGNGWGNDDISGSSAARMAPFANLNTDYKTMLSWGVYGYDYAFSSDGQIDWPNCRNQPWTLTLDNLIVGKQYLFQSWVSDPRAVVGHRTETLSGGGAATRTIKFNVARANGGVGQYVIGTFTANATSQAITCAAGDGRSCSEMSGFQLRLVSKHSSNGNRPQSKK